MKTFLAIAAVAVGLVFAAPAQADDPDTDFNAELQTYGIYGQKDFHAWIGKLTCKRLYRGVDKNAYQSAQFVSHQLARTTTEQAWQFLGGALRTYCPEQLPVLQQAAEH